MNGVVVVGAVSDPLGKPVVPEAGGGVERQPAADRATTRLHAMTKLARAIATVRRLDEVIHVTAVEARAALDAASVAIATVDRDTGRIQVLGTHSEHDADNPPYPRDDPPYPRDDPPYPRDETSYRVRDFPDLFGRPEETGRRVFRVDDPSTDQELAALMRKRGRACCLLTPIILDGRPWGGLYSSRGPDQPVFDEQDVEFAAMLTTQIAAGLAQAGHYERIERLAYSDPLTGLANRRAIDDRLEQAMERHRTQGAVVSLMVCDLNGLKRLNDERGHDAGDQFLIDFAGLLSRAGARLPGCLAARLGGDEFCLLVEGHTADETVRTAEEVCRMTLRMASGDGVACGVASTGDPVGLVVTAERLFRLADAAQYRAKRSRSTRPVVAGRGLSPDPSPTLNGALSGTLNGVTLSSTLSDAVNGHSRRGSFPRGDRDLLRGPASRDAVRLLSVGLTNLDAARGASAQARLEVVAHAAARLVDAAGWWVSYLEPGSRVLRTRQFSVYRMTSRMTGEPNPEPDLDRYPMIAAAVEGGGFVLERGTSGNDPAEEAILAAGGYRALLAAGGRYGDGGWLIEVFTDELSDPVYGLAPPLRALIAVALTGAEPLESPR